MKVHSTWQSLTVTYIVLHSQCSHSLHWLYPAPCYLIWCFIALLAFHMLRALWPGHCIALYRNPALRCWQLCMSNLLASFLCAEDVTKASVHVEVALLCSSPAKLTCTWHSRLVFWSYLYLTRTSTWMPTFMTSSIHCIRLKQGDLLDCVIVIYCDFQSILYRDGIEAETTKDRSFGCDRKYTFGRWSETN